MGYIYWCAACGNPDIIIESAKEGYSISKGLVGAAILGSAGAAAGFDGKDVNVYYCPKCGARLRNPMADYEVNDILNLLKSPDIYRNMLEAKRKRYPNMMWPKNWQDAVTTALENDNSVLGENTVKANSTRKPEMAKETEIELLIIEYLVKNGAPVKEGPIAVSLGLTDKMDEVNEAVNSLKENHIIENVVVDGRNCIVLTAQAENNYQETVNKVKEIAKVRQNSARDDKERIEQKYAESLREYEDTISKIEQDKEKEYEAIMASFVKDVENK